MNRWWHDPATRPAVILALVSASGLVALGAAWRGVANLGVVPLQVPWVVSGGLGGLALLGAGIALLDVHWERRRAAGDRSDLDSVIREAERLVDRVVEQRARARRQRRRRSGEGQPPRRRASQERDLPASARSHRA